MDISSSEAVNTLTLSKEIADDLKLDKTACYTDIISRKLLARLSLFIIIDIENETVNVIKNRFTGETGIMAITKFEKLIHKPL
jgi:hypothetical protein